MKTLVRISLMIAAFLVLASAASAQVLVIANPGVKASSISRKDLKEVFSGSSTALAGSSQVGPVLQKGGAAHEAFLTEFIGKNDATFRAGWRSLVFSGQANMPKSLDGDVAVVDFVARTPGAIGYIASNSPHEGVKVLPVH